MKKIRLHPSQKEIEYDSGDSVLSTLEKHGLLLPNNCRAGACGECKLKIKAGTIDQGFILDMALSPQERQEGYALMCMAKQTSDLLEIEWESEGKPKLFPPVENLLYMLLDKTFVTKKIVKLKLKALGTPLRFWPGQFVRFGFPEKQIEERSYSIANIPNNDGEIILFVTKNGQGQMSSYVHDSLEIGTIVKINGPYGTFIGDPSSERPIICLAQGSGLAPIMSLSLAAMLRGGMRNPVTVYFSAKTHEDIFEKGVFKYLEKKFRNFKFKYTLTEEVNQEGYSGRIQKILPEIYTDLSEYDFYIAGSQDFVSECKKKVISLNAKQERVFLEGFVKN